MVAINVPAGIVKNEASKAVNGRYIDGNHVRFRKGKAEKMGGYVAYLADTFLGLARGMLGWKTKAGKSLTALGTYIKLYSASDTLQDITPYRLSGTEANNPFATVAASAVVTVTHVAHGVANGAHVHFSGAAAFNGVTISGEYVATVGGSADTFTITHSVAASGTGAGGGAAVAYNYEINPGTLSTTAGVGYGVGHYGAAKYGRPRAAAGTIQITLRSWSLARYGGELLASPSGGGLYLWDEPGSAARAVIVSNAPTMNQAMFVTAERFVTVLGTYNLSAVFDPMGIRWADIDDITNWTPAAANTSNFRVLQYGSKMLGGAALGDRGNILWSDTAAYLHSYDGSSFVYDTRLIGEECGLLASDAFCTENARAYWWGVSTFQMFDGSVREIPNDEDVRAYVYDNLNLAQVAKCFCGYVKENNEIWFGYASGVSEEPDRYVAVCTDDWSWTIGTLARTGMTSYKANVEGGVIMASTDSMLFEHEIGVDANGAAFESYIEHGLVALDPRRDMDVDGYIPSFQRQEGDLTVFLATRNREQDADDLESQTKTIAENQSLVDFRLGGRFVRGRLTSNVVGGDFRLGIPEIELKLGGKSIRSG